jgi:starch synthase
MSKKRILFITQEMEPYSIASDIATFVRKIPQYVHDKGFEIRILMPRFGTINERRHRLHEVVRLSGMNIIVDDEDYPLIIKVASLPGARIQVYFLDNEEFFKRKFIFTDEDDKAFDDNTERMVFFCKGVIETVKKFGWAPDIVHCSGWMSSLVPAYLKTVYKNDPIFQDAKVVYSVYADGVDPELKDSFLDIASINDLDAEQLAAYKANGTLSLQAGGVSFADAVHVGSETIANDVRAAIDKVDVPVQEYADLEETLPAMLEFFTGLLPAEEEEEEA